MLADETQGKAHASSVSVISDFDIINSSITLNPTSGTSIVSLVTKKGTMIGSCVFVSFTLISAQPLYGISTPFAAFTFNWQPINSENLSSSHSEN